jgi:hypothetical protein
MANEINIAQDTGLTLTAKVYTLAGVQQGSTVSLTEVVTGIYSGNFALTGVSDGRYTVLFFNGATIVGFGSLFVVDELEVDIHKLETRLQSIAEHDATQATLANKLDSSSYVAPDNAGIATIKAKTDNLPAVPASQGDVTALNNLSLAQVEASTILAKEATSQTILTDTSELQTNQGNWLTATGFATPTNVSDSQTAIIAQIDANETKINGIKAKTDNLPSDPADQSSLEAAIAALNDLSLAEIEASNVLAKESTVAAKLDASSYTVPDNAGITGIKAKTDLLSFTGNDVKATLDEEQVLASNMVSLSGIATTANINNAVTNLKGADNKDLTQVFNNIPAIDLTPVTDELALVKTQATLARKHLTNRDKINKTAKTLIRYDDDGTTPLVTFDLKNSNGDASSDSIFEKVPK